MKTTPGMPRPGKAIQPIPQFSSRVVHKYRALSRDELRFVLDRHWHRLGLTLDPGDFTDPKPSPPSPESPEATSGSSEGFSPRDRPRHENQRPASRRGDARPGEHVVGRRFPCGGVRARRRRRGSGSARRSYETRRLALTGYLETSRRASHYLGSLGVRWGVGGCGTGAVSRVGATGSLRVRVLWSLLRPTRTGSRKCERFRCGCLLECSTGL